jgi:serine/threonine-protein kinase RsbW
LPINAAYVSAVRLTASSIAYRMGFEIDCIEDIKSAVSEACTFIIKKIPKQHAIDNSFKIIFDLKNDSIEILIKLVRAVEFVDFENEMSLLVLKALVDSLDVDISGNKLTSLKLTKLKKENILETLEG